MNAFPLSYRHVDSKEGKTESPIEKPESITVNRIHSGFRCAGIRDGQEKIPGQTERRAKGSPSVPKSEILGDGGKNQANRENANGAVVPKMQACPMWVVGSQALGTATDITSPCN